VSGLSPPSENSIAVVIVVVVVVVAIIIIIIIIWKFKKLDTGVDSIDLSQERKRFIGVYEYSVSIKFGKFN
jgi:flagellar basal body-associated protein FliL